MELCNFGKAPNWVFLFKFPLYILVPVHSAMGLLSQVFRKIFQNHCEFEIITKPPTHHEFHNNFDIRNHYEHRNNFENSKPLRTSEQFRKFETISNIGIFLRMAGHTVEGQSLQQKDNNRKKRKGKKKIKNEKPRDLRSLSRNFDFCAWPSQKVVKRGSSEKKSILSCCKRLFE